MCAYTYNLIRREAEGLLVGRNVGWSGRWREGGLEDHRAVWGIIITA
jgi:hypothetical protein